jgi:hypothetical protein
VADGQIFEEPKKGLLARLLPRLLGTRTIKGTVRRREQLNLLVPTERAESARAAVELWLESHGVTAVATVEQAEGGKSRVKAKLGEADAAKLDFSSDQVQSELQDALLDALGGSRPDAAAPPETS